MNTIIQGWLSTLPATSRTCAQAVGATLLALAATASFGAERQFNSKSAKPYRLEIIPMVGSLTMIPNAINDAGQVVGRGVGNVPDQALLYSNGNTISLAAPDWRSSRAFGINELGQVVGDFSPSSGTGGSYIYSDGGPNWIPYSDSDTALSINNNGAISSNRGRVYLSGAYIDIPPIPNGDLPSSVTAYKINDLGSVTGFGYYLIAGGSYVNRAYRWTGSGNAISLGTLGGVNSYGWSINNSGAVVGQSELSDLRVTHAFVYSGKKMKDLGTLSSGHLESSYAYGINDAGQVVGSSDDFQAGNSRPFIYSEGRMKKLFDLIPAREASGWQLAIATAINNTAEIAGYGIHNGILTAFVARPAP